MNPIIYASMAMTLNKLTLIELAVLNNVAQTNGDPHNRIFDYDKVSHLFTELNGTRMHDESKEALGAYVNNRFHDDESE